MNDEQRAARKKSAEEGNIRWIKEHCLRTKDDDEDYVFISYKSDDFEKVLDDILFNTCKKYGLRVYFDTAFDEDSDSWITQYYDNMCDPHCKAFIAFIDDAYYSSYACLLEMMSRKTAAAGGDYKLDSLFFLPINIGSITDVINNSNTGLGTRRYSNGKINNNADVELKQFNDIFKEIADEYMRRSLYKRENDTQLYEEAYGDMPKYGKVYLTITQCRKLMERVIPNKNDNDGGNKAFADVIHDKLDKAGLGSVFGKIKDDVNPPKDDEYDVVIINGEKKSTLRIKEGDLIPKQDPGIRDDFEFEGWFVSETDEEWDFADPVDQDIEIYARWEDASTPPPTPAEGYKYTIFGEEYEAGSREQGKLMFDAFDALVKRYPGCAEQLTQRTSIARAEDVKNANTQEADPTYFRGCKSFSVNGKEYLVGTSYGYKAKIAEIKGMFKICGVDSREFVLNGEPLKPKSSKVEKTGKEVGKNDDVFEYELWGLPHTANKLVDMINDVFDLIAEKHPDKIQNIADSHNITAVARKDELDQGKVNGSKANQFAYYKGKEHSVNGVIYCVNAGYNREGGVGQLKKMLVLCEGSSDGFKITKAPEKSSRSGGKTGKTDCE